MEGFAGKDGRIISLYQQTHCLSKKGLFANGNDMVMNGDERPMTSPFLTIQSANGFVVGQVRKGWSLTSSAGSTLLMVRKSA